MRMKLHTPGLDICLLCQEAATGWDSTICDFIEFILKISPVLRLETNWGFLRLRWDLLRLKGTQRGYDLKFQYQRK